MSKKNDEISVGKGVLCFRCTVCLVVGRCQRCRTGLGKVRDRKGALDVDPWSELRDGRFRSGAGIRLMGLFPYVNLTIRLSMKCF